MIENIVIVRAVQDITRLHSNVDFIFLSVGPFRRLIVRCYFFILIDKRYEE
jgi:hypothetical protein